MYVVDSIQVTTPRGFTFKNRDDFLEAQRLATKEVETYLEYKDFCYKADMLREKSGVNSEEELDIFLTEG